MEEAITPAVAAAAAGGTTRISREAAAADAAAPKIKAAEEGGPNSLLLIKAAGEGGPNSLLLALSGLAGLRRRQISPRRSRSRLGATDHRSRHSRRRPSRWLQPRPVGEAPRGLEGRGVRLLRLSLLFHLRRLFSRRRLLLVCD